MRCPHQASCNTRPKISYRHFCFALLVSLANAAWCTSAIGNTVAEFNTAYNAYHEAVETDQAESRLLYARQTLQIAKSLPQITPTQIAVLTHNLANAYYANGEVDKGIDVINDSIDLYREHYGDPSPELARALMDKARLQILRSQHSPRDAAYQAAKAVEQALAIIAASTGAAEDYAVFLLAGARIMEAAPGNQEKVEHYLIDHYELQRRSNKPDSFAIAAAAYELARFHAEQVFQDRRRDKDAQLARHYLDPALIFAKGDSVGAASDEGLDDWKKQVYDTAYRLYFILEEMETALAHCIRRHTLGPTVGAFSNQDFRKLEEGDPKHPLLVRVAPRYPAVAMRRGWGDEVTIRYDVDEKGNTVDPQVISAEHPELFAEPSLAAIRKWKFLPQCDEQGFVRVKDVESVLRFQVRK